MTFPGTWVAMDPDGKVESLKPEPGLWTLEKNTKTAVVCPGVRMIWLEEALASDFPINHSATGIAEWMRSTGCEMPELIRGRVVFTSDIFDMGTSIYGVLSNDAERDVRMYGLKSRMTIAKLYAATPVEKLVKVK